MKIVYKRWCDKNGLTNILDKANEGISFWSANPNDKPSVGMPSGFSEYGTYIILKAANIRFYFTFLFLAKRLHGEQITVLGKSSADCCWCNYAYRRMAYLLC